jgi:hypothetical protein
MIYNKNIVLLPSTVIIGKYRIAACPRLLSSDRFTAQVSIASGIGGASANCVIRFVDDFFTIDAAASLRDSSRH